MTDRTPEMTDPVSCAADDGGTCDCGHHEDDHGSGCNADCGCWEFEHPPIGDDVPGPNQLDLLA
jgi:hypothetical protein